MKNPFITGKFATGEYYCERPREFAEIKNFLENGHNVALLSPRHMGKSSFILQLFQDPGLREEYYCIFVDIYATRSMEEFVAVFSKAIFETIKPKGKSALIKALHFISSLRPAFSIDVNGESRVYLEPGHFDNPGETFDEIISFLDNADKPCIVAFDEFQQIATYGDKALEEKLRFYIQSCTNANFIFSGSQREMLDEMFIVPPRPFYYSVSIVYLPPLNIDVYQAFCTQRFEATGKHMNSDVVVMLYDLFDAVTGDVQRVMNTLFFMTETGATCDSSMVHRAIEDIVSHSLTLYEYLLAPLTGNQRRLLYAIANEKRAKGVTGKIFMNKYDLQTASRVKYSLRLLLDRDLISENGDYYFITDRFLGMWLRSPASRPYVEIN